MGAGGGGPWEQLGSSIEAASRRWQSSVSTSAQMMQFPGSVVHIHNFLDSLRKPQRRGNSKQPDLFRFLRRIRLPFAGVMISNEDNFRKGLNGRGQDVEREKKEELLHVEQRQMDAWSDGEEISGQLGSGFNSELLLQLPAQVSSGGAVSKEDLGRATWTLLHTLAAQFPENPTRQQQRDVKELMSIMTRLYPCKQCAEHFKEVLKAYPVRANSGVDLAQWMCQVHNVVNRSLGKPQFPCQRVDARWGELDCDEGACDLEGRLPYN